MNNITKVLIKEAIREKAQDIASLKVSMLGTKLSYTVITERFKEIKKIDKQIKKLQEDLERYK